MRVLNNIWVGQLVAVVAALMRSAQYVKLLAIRRGEFRRYFFKSVNFALCYAPFSPQRQIGESWRAGEAAFICCAYDVITDWRSFRVGPRRAFEEILASLVKDHSIRDLAVNLYEKELLGDLANDGLERGAIALQFVIDFMGCAAECQARWLSIADIGETLQVVDDVLDIDDDIRHGDMNCLLSPRYRRHLERFAAGLERSRVEELFGGEHHVLAVAIERAHKRALRMLITDVISRARVHVSVS